MRETNNLQGHLTLQMSDRSGRVVYQKRFKNRIVTTGRRLVAEFFSGVVAGAPPAAVTHMAVGENATPPADGHTALQSQRGDRNLITDAVVDEIVDGSVARVQVSLQAVFDFGEANDPGTPLTEAGIFNAATDGVMYNRVVFEPVTKTDAFKLTLFWDIVF